MEVQPNVVTVDISQWRFAVKLGDLGCGCDLDSAAELGIVRSAAAEETLLGTRLSVHGDFQPREHRARINFRLAPGIVGKA